MHFFCILTLCEYLENNANDKCNKRSVCTVKWRDALYVIICTYYYYYNFSANILIPFEQQDLFLFSRSYCGQLSWTKSASWSFQIIAERTQNIIVLYHFKPNFYLSCHFTCQSLETLPNDPEKSTVEAQLRLTWRPTTRGFGEVKTSAVQVVQACPEVQEGWREKDLVTGSSCRDLNLAPPSSNWD